MVASSQLKRALSLQSSIKTIDGYVIPLNIKDGLPRLELQPYTDKDWNQLPHVIMTAEIDHALDEDEHWFDAVEALEDNPDTNAFDEYGNYMYWVHDDGCGPPPTKELSDDKKDLLSIDHLILECMQACHTTSGTATDDGSPNGVAITVEAPHVSKREPDYEWLCPYFGWLPADAIKHTFQHTTQYAHHPVSTLLKRLYKLPNPAPNVIHQNESLACDVVYSDTLAINNGSKLAVVFISLDMQVTDIYGIKSDKLFINTLEDNIRERGAPKKLISDRGSVSVNMSWISCGHCASTTGKVSRRCSTRTILSGAIKLSRQPPTIAWTELELHHPHGSCASCMCATYSITRTMPTLTTFCSWRWRRCRHDTWHLQGWLLMLNNKTGAVMRQL
jgi:hypothetical protein